METPDSPSRWWSSKALGALWRHAVQCNKNFPAIHCIYFDILSLGLWPLSYLVYGRRNFLRDTGKSAHKPRAPRLRKRGILAATRVLSTHDATKHGATDTKTKNGRLYADRGYWHTHTQGPDQRFTGDPRAHSVMATLTLTAIYRPAVNSIHEKRKILSQTQFLSSGHVNTTFFVYNCLIPVFFLIFLKGPMMNWLNPKHAATGEKI